MLNNMQMEELHQVLVHSLYGLTFYINEKSDINEEKVDYVNIFI